MTTASVSGTYLFDSGIPARPKDHLPTKNLPFGELKLGADGTWSVGWMMMDFEWKGTWTLSGSRLTLELREPKGFVRSGHTFLELEVQDKDHLRMVGGDFATAQKSDFLPRAPVIPRTMLDDAERDRVKNRARYVAEATKMYVNDTGKPLPKTQTEFERETIAYTGKDCKGFIYTFPGGPLPKGEAAATTEIRWIQGPDGKAIAFADGHMEWRQRSR